MAPSSWERWWWKQILEALDRVGYMVVPKPSRKGAPRRPGPVKEEKS